MKKPLILFTILLLTAPAFSQKGFEGGVRFMFQNTWLLNRCDLKENNKALTHEMTWRPAFGIATGYNFSEHFGFHANVLYASQGQNYTGSVGAWGVWKKGSLYYHTLELIRFGMGITGAYTLAVKLNYIQVPLFLSYNANPHKRVHFRALLGPRFSLLTSAKYRVNGREFPYGSLFNPVNDLYNNFVIGIAMGLGADFKITEKLKINLHQRFAFDLHNIESKVFWHEDRGATRNVTTGLMLGLTYRLDELTEQ